ncbi:MAG: hypothetical protein KBT03_03700 [Bacteroidales bacterium]|nr:hypothetical protein [Candidatus Scybalousia scybalohippi]
MSIKKIDKTYLELQFSNFASRISNVFARKTDLPTKTSELTNDSNFPSDANYVHTDNNYTTTEKNKLNGIETNAQANVIEGIKVNNTAQTITDKSVNITVPTKASDIGALDDSITHLSGDVPTTRKINNKALSSDITLNADDVNALNSSLKGANNGIAELDENGKVPSSQLPSYIDNVEEYDTRAEFPSVGEDNKIYIDKSTNITYRWGGTDYVAIGSDLSLGETSTTAYRGDRGKIAYDHSQVNSGNPHNVTKSDVGLSNVENKSSATIRGELTKSNVTTALGYTPPTTDTTYSVATTSTNGLMSSTDKSKLDGIANGATANIGTITEIKMNGSSKGTSGVVDLGTVITDVSGKQDKITSTNKLSYSLISDTPTIPTVTDTYSATSSNAMSGKAVASAISGKMDKTTVLTGGSQTTTSTEDGGSNIYTFTKSDGTTSTLTVKNGNKGSNGTNGISAGFGTPTATIDANVGTPSVTVTASGADTAKVFNFDFKNLKGAKGDKGNNITISSQSVTYQASSSGVEIPTGTWSTTVPSVTKGQFLWSKTVVTYSDSTSTTTYSVGYQGTNGTNGTNGTTPTIKASSGANIGSVGTPTVTATTSGTTTTFTFDYLKGAKGDKGDNATTTAVVSTSANGLAPKVTSTNGFLKGNGTWAIPTNTTYTFANGTTANTFTVTPRGGSAQTITITPALAWK